MESVGIITSVPEQPVLANSAQNILVKKESGTWKVTGVIDWDDVMSVPAVIGRKAPVWLWDPEIHVADADVLPAREYDDNQRQIKAKLEEVLRGPLQELEWLPGT